MCMDAYDNRNNIYPGQNPFSSADITMPDDPEKKQRLLEFVAATSGKVDSSVGVEYAELVANGQMAPQLASHLAASNLRLPNRDIENQESSLRPAYMGSFFDHRQRKPQTIEEFSQYATAAVKDKSAIKLRSIEHIGRDELVALVDDRDMMLKQLSEFVGNRRKAVQQQYYDIAEKWGAMSHLDRHEACHGAIWEVQSKFGDTFALSGNGKPFEAHGGLEYAILYDENQAENIKAGLAKSAAQIFT